MEICNKVNISLEKFNKVSHRKVGEGRDAVVYDAGKGLLYKVYKDEVNLKDSKSPVKIYTKDSVIRKPIPERNCYIDKDGIKIYYRDAIKKIVKRQEKINTSSLPKAPLYVDNRFTGCVLKKIHGVQLHYLFPFLLPKTKVRVLKTILSKVKELTDNYVYPGDLNNSPIAGYHSNILIDYKLEPQLIDLDGHSTVYREEYDEKEYNWTLYSLNMLMLELIHGSSYDLDPTYYDINFLKNDLIKDGINEELANNLSRYKASYEELDELIMHYSK